MMFEVGKIYRTKAGRFTKLVPTPSDDPYHKEFPFYGVATDVTYNSEGKHLLSGAESKLDLYPEAYEEITDPEYILQVDDLLDAAKEGWGFVSCDILHLVGRRFGDQKTWACVGLRRVPKAPPKEVLRWVNVLRWEKDTKPDKAGLWALRSREGMSVYTVTNPDLLYSKGEYCYLGPIPEILPALKKVRKFMWLEYMDSDACNPGESVYKEHWIDEGEEPDVPGWLRTDKWTEVIV